MHTRGLVGFLKHHWVFIINTLIILAPIAFVGVIIYALTSGEADGPAMFVGLLVILGSLFFFMIVPLALANVLGILKGSVLRMNKIVTFILSALMVLPSCFLLYSTLPLISLNPSMDNRMSIPSGLPSIIILAAIILIIIPLAIVNVLIIIKGYRKMNKSKAFSAVALWILFPICYIFIVLAMFA